MSNKNILKSAIATSIYLRVYEVEVAAGDAKRVALWDPQERNQFKQVAAEKAAAASPEEGELVKFYASYLMESRQPKAELAAYRKDPEKFDRAMRLFQASSFIWKRAINRQREMSAASFKAPAGSRNVYRTYTAEEVLAMPADTLVKLYDQEIAEAIGVSRASINNARNEGKLAERVIELHKMATQRKANKEAREIKECDKEPQIQRPLITWVPQAVKAEIPSVGKHNGYTNGNGHTNGHAAVMTAPVDVVEKVAENPVFAAYERTVKECDVVPSDAVMMAVLGCGTLAIEAAFRHLFDLGYLFGKNPDGSYSVEVRPLDRKKVIEDIAAKLDELDNDTLRSVLQLVEEAATAPAQ